MDIREESLKKHADLAGKLSVVSKGKVDDMHDLSVYYSPGVGAVSAHLASAPDETPIYTGTNNSVAIVSDGSAVLGLGNIGAKAALPVMEGKAMLFNRFAGIDGYPVVLDVHTADEIVATVKAIAPSYGAINLEDIAAPVCFEVEERLKNELDIPIMHDDQHGTAIVVLAGLLNSMEIVGKSLDQTRIAIVGAGAAGTAIAKLITLYAPKSQTLMVDSVGIISSIRTDLNPQKKQLLEFTNRADINGSLDDAIEGADIFIGVSKPGLLTTEHIKSMSDKPVIFALANPDPEILPELAKQAGAEIIATGRSDYPNQVNNALAFPGIFRGALDNQVSKITDQHKIAVAETIASLVSEPSAEQIIPNVFDERLVGAIAKAIK